MSDAIFTIFRLWRRSARDTCRLQLAMLPALGCTAFRSTFAVGDDSPPWLSFRQSSLHPRTQFLSQPLSRRLLIGGLAPFPTCFGHCSWFPSQFSRMITGLCVSPDALLSAHFCSARAAFLRLTGAPIHHQTQFPYFWRFPFQDAQEPQTTFSHCLACQCVPPFPGITDKVPLLP